MRLIDLEPAWLSPDVFIFRSPSGHGDWLTCKRVVLPMKEQYELVHYQWSDVMTKRTPIKRPVPKPKPTPQPRPGRTYYV